MPAAACATAARARSNEVEAEEAEEAEEAKEEEEEASEAAEWAVVASRKSRARIRRLARRSSSLAETRLCHTIVASSAAASSIGRALLLPAQEAISSDAPPLFCFPFVPQCATHSRQPHGQ